MNYYKSTDSDSQNLLSGHYATSDGHGGRGTQHREEMQTIAREVFKEEREALMQEIKEMMYEAQYQAYRQALEDVIRVLEYDIQSVTRIGIEGCKDVFEGKKAQKFISDQIMKVIEKELKNKTFRR